MEPDDELALNNFWEANQPDPDFMFMTYRAAEHCARLQGSVLPSHLVPGMPVVITRHGMQTYYGD